MVVNINVNFLILMVGCGYITECLCLLEIQIGIFGRRALCQPFILKCFNGGKNFILQFSTFLEVRE